MGTQPMRPLTRYDAVQVLCDAIHARGVEPTIEIIWPYLNSHQFNRNSVSADVWEWRDRHGLTVRAINAAQESAGGDHVQGA